MIFKQYNELEYPSDGASLSRTALRLAQGLIRFPSLTPITSDLTLSALNVLNYIQGYLERNGAGCRRLVFEGEHKKWSYPVDNLFAQWQFGKGSKHLCFLGHVDVVPPGDTVNWSKEPFAGVVDDGFIHGRGATDMKGAVAAFCAAAVEALPELKRENICISIILTTDEEWAAINGTRKVLDWLKKKDKTIDAAIVGEPSSSDTLGTHIKIGRRGSLCGRLIADGIQGHAAYPEMFDNPNRALSLANTILNSHRWEGENHCFPPTNFEIVAQQSGDFKETAIVPNRAESCWNIRFTPRYEVFQIQKILAENLKFPPSWARSHPDYHKLGNLRLEVNTDTAASPYYAKPDFLANIAVEAVLKVTGKKAELDASGGITDGRFLQEFFPLVQIIELGLPEKGGRKGDEIPLDYGKRGGMHQIDERCRIKDIKALSLCYKEIILKFAQSSR